MTFIKAMMKIIPILDTHDAYQSHDILYVSLFWGAVMLLMCPLLVLRTLEHISPNKRLTRSLCFYFFVHILRCLAGDKKTCTQNLVPPLLYSDSPLSGDICLRVSSSNNSVFAHSDSSRNAWFWAL